jgi:hypothetical protein
MHPCDIQVYQAAKEANRDAGYEALFDIFQSIEYFLNRLDIYSKIPSTAAMTEVVVKILVELLSVLALTTKKMKQGRYSESVFA